MRQSLPSEMRSSSKWIWSMTQGDDGRRPRFKTQYPQGQQDLQCIAVFERTRQTTASPAVQAQREGQQSDACAFAVTPFSWHSLLSRASDVCLDHKAPTPSIIVNHNHIRSPTADTISFTCFSSSCALAPRKRGTQTSQAPPLGPRAQEQSSLKLNRHAESRGYNLRTNACGCTSHPSLPFGRYWSLDRRREALVEHRGVSA